MRIKSSLIALFILLCTIIISVITYFAAFAITFLIGEVSVSDTGTATVNQGIFNLLQYTFIIIMMGYWYIRRFNVKLSTGSDFRKSLKYIFNPVSTLLLVLTGFLIQLGTGAFLYVLGETFPTFFASYKTMMSNYTGSASILFIITTITIGPIAEELVFRGLMTNYLLLSATNAKEAKNSKTDIMPSPNPGNGVIWFAIIVQALLFGLYHGNVTQGCYAFLSGILLGYLKIKTDSLLTPILLHMVINGSLYLLPDNMYLNTITANVTGFVTFAIIIILIVLLFKSYKKPERQE